MLKFLLPLKVLNLKAFRTFGVALTPARLSPAHLSPAHLSPARGSLPLPINYTVSVTNRCNARCKTCNIWRLYDDCDEEQPALRRSRSELSRLELSAGEFARIFESVGKSAYWVTLSGGEPFLRSDLVEIYDALARHCSPNIVNIPTNATAPRLVERRVRELLEVKNKTKKGKSDLILNLSLDGVGSLHDEIRGVAGNFEKFVATYERLTALKQDFENPRLRVGVHTVVSNFNLDRLEEIYEFVQGLNPKPDSHIFEVAEERVELGTVGSGVTPDYRSFAAAFAPLRERIKRDYLKDPEADFLARVTQAFRLEYYRLLEKVLTERRQPIPCYAGFASCQISAYGDVWACCVRAEPLGNLRAGTADYDFAWVWRSRKADEIRASVRRGECCCPLANAAYTSMLCDFSALRRVLGRVVR